MRSKHLGRGRERDQESPSFLSLLTLGYEPRIGGGRAADQPKAWNWHQGIGGAGRWQERLSDESEGQEALSSVSPGRCLEGF